MGFHGPIACSSPPLLIDIKHHIIRITATWSILQFWCLPSVEQTFWKVEFSWGMSQTVNVLENHWKVCCYLRMMHREEGVLGRHDITQLSQRCSVWVRITAVCDHCNYRDQDLHSIYHHSERSRISHMNNECVRRVGVDTVGLQPSSFIFRGWRISYCVFCGFVWDCL